MFSDNIQERKKEKDYLNLKKEKSCKIESLVQHFFQIVHVVNELILK